MIIYKFVTASNFREYWQSYLDGNIYFQSWKNYNDPAEGYFFFAPNQNAQQESAKTITSMKDTYTTACFASSCTHMLLWSHYAKDHKGVCLEYEVNERTLQRSGIQLKKICYARKIPLLSQQASDRDNTLTFLTTKLWFWEHESEIRLLREDGRDGQHRIGTLKKVILGKRFEMPPWTFDQAPNEDIIGSLRARKVQIHKADIDTNTYEIKHSATRQHG